VEGAPGSATGSAPIRSVSASSTASARSIELILNKHADAELTEVLKSAARTQAGLDRVRVTTWVVGEARADQAQGNSTPLPASELVREAIDRHAMALIIEPADPADQALSERIGEARAAGIPVVLLDRDLSTTEPRSPRTSTGSKPVAPLIVVGPEPFAATARQLVAAAMRNAVNSKLKPEAGAFILINSAADSLVQDRNAAIREALKAAGINAITEVRFAGDAQTGAMLLTERLQADPKPPMVFSVDSTSTTAAGETINEIIEDRPFVLAGYTADESLVKLAATGRFAALAEFAPARVIRRAVTTALAASQGQNVTSRVNVSIPVAESPSKSGVPQLQGFFKSRQIHRAEERKAKEKAKEKTSD
jgi:ABC-type sugar transport system substrate-binding protein